MCEVDVVSLLGEKPIRRGIGHGALDDRDGTYACRRHHDRDGDAAAVRRGICLADHGGWYASQTIMLARFLRKVAKKRLAVLPTENSMDFFCLLTFLTNVHVGSKLARKNRTEGCKP